jgi:transposase
VPSNTNLRTPEGCNQESSGKNTLPAGSAVTRNLPIQDPSKPPDFPPAVLPFRQPNSTQNQKDANGNGIPLNARADTYGLPSKLKGRHVAGRASTNAISDQVGVGHLDMPGWKTTKIEYKRHETLVHAALTAELTHCLYTDCRSNNIKANGSGRKLYIAHTPLDDRPRRITYRRQSYYCHDCKRTSRPPVPGLYKRHRITRRLRRYIVRQALLPEESFKGIAQRVGRSERNIRDIFEEHRAHLDAIRAIATPRVMGMDGVYIKGQESLIVTDLERRRPVMIRPFIKERAVAAALREMPNLDGIEEVVSDMSRSLERVQKEVLPNAIRTKDRYHVQRLANEAVDAVRRHVAPGRKDRKKGQMSMCRSHILRKRKKQLNAVEQASLEWCLGLYPELRLTYELKEGYCEIWASHDAETARLKYILWLEQHGAWKKKMPKELRKVFDPLIRLMKNWEEGIFNYFHARNTNAYTESYNAQVKGLGRKAPRLKLENFNAKIIYGPRLKQQRNAISERGKGQRRAIQHTQQPVLSPPMDNTGSILDSPQENTMLTSSTTGSIATDSKRQGPRLDAGRIAKLKREAGGEGDSASSSPQMSLFV